MGWIRVGIRVMLPSMHEVMGWIRVDIRVMLASMAVSASVTKV